MQFPGRSPSVVYGHAQSPTICARPGRAEYNLGIIGQGYGLGIGEEAELPVFALSVVKDDGALPASFLVVVEFAEVGDDVLSGPRLGAHALDQSVVGVRLPVFGPSVSPQEHRRLLAPRDQERVLNSR